MTNSKWELRPKPEQRRRWTLEKKLMIVDQSRKADTTIRSVAESYGITPLHLYHWRSVYKNSSSKQKNDELQRQNDELQKMQVQQTIEAPMLRKAFNDMFRQNDALKEILYEKVVEETVFRKAVTWKLSTMFKKNDELKRMLDEKTAKAEMLRKEIADLQKQ